MQWRLPHWGVGALPHFFLAVREGRNTNGTYYHLCFCPLARRESRSAGLGVGGPARGQGGSGTAHSLPFSLRMLRLLHAAAYTEKMARLGRRPTNHNAAISVLIGRQEGGRLSFLAVLVVMTTMQEFKAGQRESDGGSGTER